MATYSAQCSAVGSFSYAGNFKLYVVLTNRDGNSATNQSIVDYNVYCQSSGSGSINANHLLQFSLNGSYKRNETVGVNVKSPNAYIAISSGSATITHDTNGTKTIPFSATIKASSYGVSATCSGNFTLTTIPRYTSITSFTVSKWSETSVKYSWSAADAVDYAWYSKDNGATWGALATNGVVSGLSANTSYNFKLRVRRTDSQLTTDSGTVTQTTYKIPTQSLASKTENRITMNWSIDATADHIWYSTNGGTNWVDGGAVNATSGSYTISGLSPNTTYNVRIRLRRKTSQTTYDIASTSITTYKVPTHSLKSKTETSITMNWGADSTVDYVWYSKDNGTNWTGVDVTDSTSGTYTISGLTANTAYNIKTRCRRKATQTTYDIGPASVTTYNYPHITAVGTTDLTIGNKQTLTLYNPLSRSVTVRMNKDTASGTQLYSGTSTGTSIEFTPTASTLYSSIPSSQSGKCVYTCIYGSSSTKSTTGAYTYKIKGTETPTFTSANITNLIDTLQTAITGNNAKFIKSHNTLTGTITPMTANNSATGAKYVISATGSPSSQEKTYSTSNINFSVSNLTASAITVTAYDSRGLFTKVTVNIDLVNYSTPTISKINAVRKDGVGEYAIVSGEGTYTNWSGLTKTNSIQKLYYRWKISTDDDSKYSSWIEITDAIKTNNDGKFTFERTLDTVFTNTIGYTIQFYANDLLENTASKNGTLSTADALVWRDLKNKRFGINKKPDEALDVEGNIKASNNINATNNVTANNRMRAGTPQLLYKCDTSTLDVGTGVYIKLCEITCDSHKQGRFIDFRIFFGFGNNGDPAQNAYMDVTLQSGWNGSHNGRFGCLWELNPLKSQFKPNAVNVVVTSDSQNKYALWFYAKATYCLPSYSYSCDDGVTIKHIGNVSQTELPVGANDSCLTSGQGIGLNAYPVGAVYISTVSTSPATLFGGSWTQITDKFLYATTTSKTTGGASTHSHTQGATGASSGSTGGPSNNTSGSTTLTIDQIPSHSHPYNLAYGGTDPAKGLGYGNTLAGTFNNAAFVQNTGGGKGHTHTLSSHTHSLNSHTHTNPNTASASSMPPYFTVYAWYRTA